MKAVHELSDRGLDSATQDRIREVFCGRVCCRCQAAALRMSADRFYCDAHFPGWRRRTAATVLIFRVGTW